MTLKVRGIEAARQVKAMMEDLHEGLVEIGRAPEAERTYWVHGPGLDAWGEQVVLERIAAGCLIRVEEATYKEPEVVEVRVPEAFASACRE